VLQERLARLAVSLAVIRVGAPTEVVLNERMRRTQGALAATQAAVAEGVVAGGGTALLRSAPALDALAQDGEYGRGVDVVRSVLSEPLYWILERRLRRPGDHRPGQAMGAATASTRSRASSATCSRRAWSTRSA
jgi:chaperonin GroEL (HSP60 family)